jgi:hypothetical protein
MTSKITSAFSANAGCIGAGGGKCKAFATSPGRNGLHLQKLIAEVAYSPVLKFFSLF